MQFPGQDVVEFGNCAAHRGNLEADTSLFKLGYMERDTHGKFFKRLYQVDPKEAETVVKCRRFMMEIFNCQATVLTVITLGSDADSGKEDVLETLKNLAKMVSLLGS